MLNVAVAALPVAVTRIVSAFAIMAALVAVQSAAAVLSRTWALAALGLYAVTVALVVLIGHVNKWNPYAATAVAPALRAKDRNPAIPVFCAGAVSSGKDFQK